MNLGTVPIFTTRVPFLGQSGTDNRIKTTPKPTNSVSPLSQRCSKIANGETMIPLQHFCRYCHHSGSAEQTIISPCHCAGSMRWVHQHCLQQWMELSKTRCCEICRYTYITKTKFKPIRKWKHLEISLREWLRMVFAAVLHIAVISVVVWSASILIDQHNERRAMHWAFWVLLLVVFIGYVGGIVISYYFGAMYLKLFRRWLDQNREVTVQNCPDEDIMTGKCYASDNTQTPNNENRHQDNALAVSYINLAFTTADGPAVAIQNTVSGTSSSILSHASVNFSSYETCTAYPNVPTTCKTVDHLDTATIFPCATSLFLASGTANVSFHHPMIFAG